MTLVGRLKRNAPSTLSNPADWLVSAVTGGRTASGERVTATSALGLAPFWRGVNILSGSVGMLPFKVYQRTGEGRKEVPNAPAWKMLHDAPNPNMAADEFWALVTSHMATWGNHYSYKEPGPGGGVAALWPLNPARVSVGINKDWSLFYVVDGTAHLAPREIFHVRGPSLDGMVGYSPIQIHRQNLASDQARKRYQGEFWANDATPGVTLIHPGKLSSEAIDRVKAKWDSQHRGSSNRNKTAVLAEAMRVERLTLPMVDAQFIEQERMSATQIAQILDLPAYMLSGDNGGSSLTYSTVEGQSVDFLKWSLGPRLVRIQNAATRDLDLMPEGYFGEFVPDAVLRTTTKERNESYALADYMTVDEKRQRENLPLLGPEKGGDVISATTQLLNATQGGQNGN